MSSDYQRKRELQLRANKRFNNASGAGRMQESIPDNARTIKLKLSLIDTTKDGKAVIFGAVRHAKNKAANTANNTKVELVNGDFDELMQSLISGDILKIGSAKMHVVNDAQAEKDFNIIRKRYNQTGAFASFSPGDSRSPKDNNPVLLEMSDFNVTLDAYTELEYELDKSISTDAVTLTLYVTEQIDQSAVLRGGDIVKVNYNPTASQVRDGIYGRR